MSASIITKTVFFAASRDVVWAFLTQKDKLAEWFHEPASDLAQGEDYVLMGQAADGSPSRQCWGRVLEMQRPERLVYTFTVKPLDGAITTVTWTLEEASGGTRLTLLHEGIDRAAGAAALGLLTALDAGWDKHFASLREAVKAAASGG